MYLGKKPKCEMIIYVGSHKYCKGWLVASLNIQANEYTHLQKCKENRKKESALFERSFGVETPAFKALVATARQM